MKNTTLPCPRCGDLRASISVKLNAMEDDDAFVCLDCNSEFGVDLVRAIIAQWTPILAWLEQKPDTESL